MWRVCLLVHFAALPKFTVVLGFVWTVALDTLGALNSVRKGCVIPPPAVFALGMPRFMLAPLIVAIYLPTLKHRLMRLLALLLL